jgi:hypothetical protein
LNPAGDKGIECDSDQDGGSIDGLEPELRYAQKGERVVNCCQDNRAEHSAENPSRSAENIHPTYYYSRYHLQFEAAGCRCVNRCKTRSPEDTSESAQNARASKGAKNEQVTAYTDKASRLRIAADSV